jgi:hypothetical protein
VDVGRGGSRPRLLPLLIGPLALVNAPTSARQLLLPRRAQWVRVHELPAAGCANDCNNPFRGTSAHVTMDVFSDGRVAFRTGRP